MVNAPSPSSQGRSQSAGLGQRRRVALRGPGEGRLWFAAAIEEYFESRTADRRRGAKRPRLAALERRQRSFDMLACSEPVHAVVDAAAGVRKAVEASDLHLVAAAARRADFEIAEKPTVRVKRDYVRDLGASPPAPQADFVFVAGRPSRNRLAFENGSALPLRTRGFALSSPEGLPPALVFFGISRSKLLGGLAAPSRCRVKRPVSNRRSPDAPTIATVEFRPQHVQCSDAQISSRAQGRPALSRVGSRSTQHSLQQIVGFGGATSPFGMSWPTIAPPRAPRLA